MQAGNDPMIVAAVVEDIKRELFLTTDACGRGISQHVIYCDVPVSVLLVTVEWKLAPNMRNSYVPSSIMVMDLPGREMDTCKFCITNLQFCDICDRGLRSRIELY